MQVFEPWVECKKKKKQYMQKQVQWVVIILIIYVLQSQIIAEGCLNHIHDIISGVLIKKYGQMIVTAPLNNNQCGPKITKAQPLSACLKIMGLFVANFFQKLLILFGKIASDICPLSFKCQ